MPVIVPPADLGLADPTLGLNANVVIDSKPILPFIDQLKAARPWSATIDGQFGALSFEDLAPYLDDHGWPMGLPTHNGEPVPLTTILQTDLLAGTRLPGRYIVIYEGEGELFFSGAARIVEPESGPGRMIIEVTDSVDEEGFVGPILLDVLETDPDGTGNHVRDITIVHESQLDLFEAGEIFNPSYLALIDDVRSVRFKDWQRVDETDLSSWADRAVIEDAFWSTSAGAPIEVMVALANKIGVDPWFSMPHAADDEFVRNYADRVAELLDPDLKAFVEYSNEVWNSIFRQHFYAIEQAAIDLSDIEFGDGAVPWLQWYALRAAEVMDIWRAELSDSPIEMVGVLGGFVALPYFNSMFAAEAWQARGRGDLNEHFDAFALGAYFGGELGTEENRPAVQSWVGDSAGTVEDPFPEQAFLNALSHLATGRLPDGSTLPDAFDGGLPGLLNLVEQHAAFAQDNGLSLVAYEGGQHVVDANFFDIGSDQINRFFIQLTDRPELRDLYFDLLEGWRDAGGTLFEHLGDVEVPGPFGSWGLYETLDPASITPRGEAYVQFNEQTATWWNDPRPAGTFLNGQILRGTDQADDVTGTAKPDVLLGGDGNDTLNGGAGADNYHGGAGTDRIVLSGSVADYAFAPEGAGVAITGPDGRDYAFAVEQAAFGEGNVFTLFDLLQGEQPIIGVPGTPVDDVIVVQSGIEGGGTGNDLYLVPGDPTFVQGPAMISDMNGDNVVHLAVGTSLDLVAVASSTLKLSPTNGPTLTVLDAASFTYEIGGDPLNGTRGTFQDFATLVEDTLGIVDGVPMGTDVHQGGPVVIAAPGAMSGAALLSDLGPDVLIG